MVGLLGAEVKLPGRISGGMRKRAGLARALVLEPRIVLFDEPDSGLDPVRTAYLNQLIIDLNQRTDATFLIVTHDINTARTVPDGIGLLYHGHLAMFRPREMPLSSDESVVRPSSRPSGSDRSAWPKSGTPTNCASRPTPGSSGKCRAPRPSDVSRSKPVV